MESRNDNLAAGTTPDMDDVARHARGWLAATHSRVNSVARLAVAEAKLAASSVALMAFLGMLAAGFAFGAWALTVVVALQLLSAQEIPLWLAIMALALGHAVAARMLWRAALDLSSKLEFRLTRQQFAQAERAK